MFDTHCHLNFRAFDGKVDQVVERASVAGLTHIVSPGTDLETSKKAVAIASRFENVYAAVGIHPHHIFELKEKSEKLKVDLEEIEKLLQNDKVVAVGEIGLDRHYYVKTKYADYGISREFIELQKEVFKEQILMALKLDKSIIFHNREAKTDFMGVLNETWDEKLQGRVVFHCCEPDIELLEYAKQHKVYIGVDGDVTYSKEKQEFVKTVPLEMLVLETDSPFLIPEPLRSKPREARGPNEPANLGLIAEKVAYLKNISVETVAEITTENAERLFQLVS